MNLLKRLNNSTCFSNTEKLSTKADTREHLGVSWIYQELPTNKRFIAPFKHKVGSRIIGIQHINE